MLKDNLTKRQFLKTDFLLESGSAQQLYDRYAAPMPIIDFHNHLSPKDIALDRRYHNLTEIWLEGDHYKWRAMRINGVAENFITGNSTPEEKFQKWAETVPFTLRNPLYHWTHLELKNYFGIEALLNGSNAGEVYKACGDLLGREDFSALGLLKKMNVEVVCTTDDPADSLEYHAMLAQSTSMNVKMLPTFRPDRAFAIEDPESYRCYIDKLSKAAGSPIDTFDDLINALSNRINHFDSLGCRASDHGLDHLYFEPNAEQAALSIFKKVKDGNKPDQLELRQFKCAVLLSLGRLYHQNGWVQQFHLGAMRNNNTRLLRSLGADAGVDSMGDYRHAHEMSRYLDHLDATNQLAKTLIYNNNPADNEVFATMVGNFCDGSTPGKIQFGSGWWFLDQKEGMERQMNALSNMGLISRFVGMVTDSRSLLSFPRHEYFRRILCNLLGNDIEKGLIPNDLPMIGEMIRNISYFNAKSYFRF
jgi:glucuronate isomerase